MTRGIELFFVFESMKLSFYFQIYDSNYWTFSEQNSQNWTPLKIWLAEQDLLKNMTHWNWTLLFNMSQRKWLHFWSWLKEYFFFNIRLKEQWSFYFGNNDPKNWTFFWRNIYDSKNWTFFTKSKNWSFLPIWFTPRIRAFWTFSYDSKNWTVSSMTQKFCSLDLTQNWFFWLWLSERYCFVYFDSNNWTVFKIRPKGLNFFDWLINMIQRIVFSLMSHRIEHFEHERIEPSFFMTQRIEPIFWRDSIEHFSDPKNWTFFLNTTHRIELFFGMWLKELNRIFKKLTQRIDHSSLGDSKNWTLFTKWLKELNLLFQYDSKNWTFFSQMTRRLELSFTNMSDRIKLFFEKELTRRIDFLKISIKI